jgi:hypothetical protein
MTNYQETLDKFIKHVVSQAKRNLTSSGKNASKKLYNSISGEAKQFPNSIGIYFDMEEYGFFQDKGVKGANPNALPNGSKWKGVQKAPNSQFKFGSGSGPKGGLTRSLDKWIIRKGIAPRNSQGKFISRAGLKFVIARSIFMSGIEPSLFFTKPFEAAFKKFPDEMIESYGFDVVDLFDSIMKQNFKK